MEAENPQQACFICLGDETTDRSLGPLGHRCACKFLVSHKQCLLRWQLQQAGRAESHQCRFCGAQLADWKAAIASTVEATVGNAPAVMAVVFQGKTIKVPVASGPNGIEEFKKTVCSLFNLPTGTEFEVTFECKSPVFGDRLHLKGFDCFEAASYCAAVSAAKRAQHKKARAEGGAGRASGHAASSSKASKAHGATAQPTSESTEAATAESSLPALPTPFSLPVGQSHMQQIRSSPSESTINSISPTQSSPVINKQPSCGAGFFMHKLRCSLRGLNSRYNSNASSQASTAAHAVIAAHSNVQEPASPSASLASTHHTFETEHTGTASARSSSEQSTLPSLLSSEPPSVHVIDASQRGAEASVNGGARKSGSGRGFGGLLSFLRRIL